MSWLEDFDSRLSEVLSKYSPDQPRDENGQFASVGGGTTEALASGWNQDVWKPPIPDVWRQAGHITLSGLSEEEKDALNSYVAMGYINMNYSLRNPNNSFANNENDEQITKNNVNNLIALIDRNEPLPTDSMLYRGVQPNSRWRDLEVGDTFVDKGFVSTSGDWRTSTFFGSQRFYIEAPAGTKALDTTVASNGGVREREIILQAGTKFEVVGKDGGNGPIRLRVVND